jgi:DNA-binding transcriptional MocR family regulator
MENNTDKTPKWRGYFDGQKKVWYDPSISIYVKAFIRILELHRSDSTGWSISVRKLAKLLNISTNTAMEAIDEALRLGLVETNIKQQRKRRKLNLSVALRAPVTHKAPNSKSLYQQVRQPVSQGDTDSVSTSETVNNKDNLQNANTEESQVKPEKKIVESNPYKEDVSRSFSNSQVPRKSAGLEQLRDVVERIRKP